MKITLSPSSIREIESMVADASLQLQDCWEGEDWVNVFNERASTNETGWTSVSERDKFAASCGKSVIRKLMDEMQRRVDAEKAAQEPQERPVPLNFAGPHKTGELPEDITPERIADVLGFAPNIDDDPSKVKFSWGFTYKGEQCGIWDYKGSRWSTYGPHWVFAELFGQ